MTDDLKVQVVRQMKAFEEAADVLGWTPDEIKGYLQGLNWVLERIKERERK